MQHDSKKAEATVGKDRYEPPQLERHGTVDELTEAFVGFDIELVAGSH